MKINYLTEDLDSIIKDTKEKFDDQIKSIDDVNVVEKERNEQVKNFEDILQKVEQKNPVDGAPKANKPENAIELEPTKKVTEDLDSADNHMNEYFDSQIDMLCDQLFDIAAESEECRATLSGVCNKCIDLLRGVKDKSGAEDDTTIAVEEDLMEGRKKKTYSKMGMVIAELDSGTDINTEPLLKFCYKKDKVKNGIVVTDPREEVPKAGRYVFYDSRSTEKNPDVEASFKGNDIIIHADNIDFAKKVANAYDVPVEEDREDDLRHYKTPHTLRLTFTDADMEGEVPD